MSRTRVTGRRWAYCGALLGGAVSVAANVAHSYVPPEGAPVDWRPQVGAVVGAVFWPVAVVVVVEIFARISWPAGRRWVALRFGGLVPVAVVAAIVSYRHMSGLLDFYDEDPLTVVIGPLAVDGLMVMATGALIATSRLKPPAQPVDAEPAPEPVVEPVGEPSIPETAVQREPVVEPVPEPRRSVSRKRHREPARSSAERVIAAHATEPTATHQRIAELAQVSVATVKRHRPTGSPQAPSEPASEPAPGEPANGRVPHISGVAG